jgi:IMP dehydrogenase
MTILRAKDFLQSELCFLAPNQTVFEAYAQMTKHRVRHLPVVENGKAVGMISDRDLQFIKDFGQNEEILCEDIMSADPYIVGTETAVSEMSQEMVERRINSALICDDKDKIVGIFTATDALKILASQPK